jgi:hypothetical protein
MGLLMVTYVSLVYSVSATLSTYREGYYMALVRDVVKVTIAELGFNKVEPTTKQDWQIVNNYLLERCKP